MSKRRGEIERALRFLTYIGIVYTVVTLCVGIAIGAAL